ncbi:MAG: hypothetical protein ACFFEF_18370, partial [Candidatus Thorarchaeota archaeon]
ENIDIRRPDMPGSTEGIVVVASLELLRKAAGRVLFEFKEMQEKLGDVSTDKAADMKIGDTVIFKEDMDLLPAEIIAVKIGRDQWYVMSTTEIPETGYPTTKDAMRVAAAEERRLKLLKDFLAKEAGNLIVKEVQEWIPDKREEADNLRAIIENATRRWGH